MCALKIAYFLDKNCLIYYVICDKSDKLNKNYYFLNNKGTNCIFFSSACALMRTCTKNHSLALIFSILISYKRRRVLWTKSVQLNFFKIKNGLLFFYTQAHPPFRHSFFNFDQLKETKFEHVRYVTFRLFSVIFIIYFIFFFWYLFFYIRLSVDKSPFELLSVIVSVTEWKR